jgi:adenylate kinase family enzyme
VRRVLVIGAPGSGKSTLATRLAATLGIPVHYLDRHYWKPGWGSIATPRMRASVCAQLPKHRPG